MITQIIKLNLVPGKVLPRANVVQYDFGSRNLEFQIWDGGQRFILTGAMTARIQGTKPDRLGFDYAATVDTTNNIITADLTQQMTPVSGEVMCEIVIKKTGERIGTLNFVLVVQPAALNEATSTSESDLPDIIALAEEQMHQCMISATKAESYAVGGTNTRLGEDTDNAKYYSQNADGAATDAAADALKAEGFAVGEQNGTAVASGSPYYHNNAEYFKDQAEAAAQDAQQWSGNPPYIGANGNWYVYNTTTHSFVDSGIDASITVRIADITMLAYGTSPYVTNTGTATDPIFHLFIPRGSSVTGCTKTSTSGLVDTYKMTFSDGYSTTFTVANGRGISNITKTGTSGLVDTYTITYNDGTTSTYTVTNGRDGVDSQISSLSDVDITSPATDDGLVYDGTSGKWENKALADVAFSGAYGDLSNTPTLGTAAAKDVPASGNASTTQVVMGNDTRLTDARNAADVSAWAKAASKPSYTASEISYGTGSNVGSEIQALANSKAPTSHASTGTAYGAGNASNYGHVKVSDNYTSSAGNASQSVAASSKAVNDVYTALTQTLTTKVNTSDIANNLTTTTAGKVLDATQGKALNDLITALQNLNTVVSITADKGFSNTIVVNAKKWGKLVVVSGWLLLEADTYTDAKPVLVIPNIRPWGNSYGLAISTNGTKTVRLYPLDRNSRTEMVLDGSPTLSEQTRFYFNMTYVSQ